MDMFKINDFMRRHHDSLAKILKLCEEVNYKREK